MYFKAARDNNCMHFTTDNDITGENLPVLSGIIKLCDLWNKQWHKGGLSWQIPQGLPGFPVNKCHSWSMSRHLRLTNSFSPLFVSSSESLFVILWLSVIIIMTLCEMVLVCSDWEDFTLPSECHTTDAVRFTTIFLNCQQKCSTHTSICICPSDEEMNVSNLQNVLNLKFYNS